MFREVFYKDNCLCCLTFLVYRSLPTICEVDDRGSRDALLSDDYDKLPPLRFVMFYFECEFYFVFTDNCRFGSLRPWSTTANSGMSLVRFSQWAIQCPELDFEYVFKFILYIIQLFNFLLFCVSNACNAIRFTRYKNFIGPSRISPLDVNILYTTRDFKRSTLQCNFKTAICLSAILSQECFLISASTTGLHNKYISGHFHQLEWERFQAFACMVFNKPSMIAQINNYAISFGTMGPSKSLLTFSIFSLLFLIDALFLVDREVFSSPSKYASYQGNPRNPSILISPGSTSVGRSQGKTGSSFQSVLNYMDDGTNIFIFLFQNS